MHGLGPPAQSSDDAASARAGAVEGSATLLSGALGRPAPRRPASRLGRLSRSKPRSNRKVSFDADAYMLNSLRFAYDDGARFAARLYRQGGNAGDRSRAERQAAALHGADPAPGALLAGERPEAIRLKTRAALGRGFTRLTSGTIGEFDTGQMLLFGAAADDDVRRRRRPPPPTAGRAAATSLARRRPRSARVLEAVRRGATCSSSPGAGTRPRSDVASPAACPATSRASRSCAARRRRLARRPRRRRARSGRPRTRRSCSRPPWASREGSPRGRAEPSGARGQLGLEPVDRVDRRRVGAAQDGEVERDEVAEQDERDEPLDGASRRAARRRATGVRLAGRRCSRGQRDARRGARCRRPGRRGRRPRSGRTTTPRPSRRSRCGRARAARPRTPGPSRSR